MDIDISSIDYKKVPINYFLEFVNKKFREHCVLVKDCNYKRVAFTTSNENKFKKFREEIVPLKFFMELENVKSKYKYVKYMSGDQPGDAFLDDSTTVEITKAQHKKRHQVTQDMIKHGYAFSAKGQKDKASVSVPTKTSPYAYTNQEHVEDNFQFIKNRIEEKAEKGYPPGSILIVAFESDTLMLECNGDYDELEKKIKGIQKGNFSQIYIVEKNFIKGDLKPKWQILI